MNRNILIALSASLLAFTAQAQIRTIDISGNNTSSEYKTYDQQISIPVGQTVNVKMARYCYFSSTITGKGILNLYAGGERCYLGTAKGASWPNWTNYTGNIHIYPFPENSSAAGFYGVVLAHGGKSFSPENIEEAVKNGRVNSSMANNHVTLHEGATICCEANTAGAGFRIGELQTEVGSTLQGYMKNSRAAYYLLGCLNTDATLAGTIAPSSYRDDTPLGIIKEGTGTYTITGNQNYLSGALRVLKGRVLVMNDAAEAKSKKLRGALGARPNDTEAIAYVFGDGILGGTGSIGGTVDNYGIVAPGADDFGLLTIQNYATPTKSAHLVMHPASVIQLKVASTERHDQLTVGGLLKYSDMTQDFSTSEEQPVVKVIVDEEATLQVGDELPVLTAKAKSGNWQFKVQASKYTWKLAETEENGAYVLKLRLESLSSSDDPDDPDNPDDNTETSSLVIYDDGISEASDAQPLRYYAQKNGKNIGVAISTWKTDISNESLAETKEAGKQFNLLAAENEMKMDALQPSRGQFTFGSADNLVNFAKRHQMALRGHCLVWHQQQPQWVSSDGKKNDKNWSRQEALQIMKTHIETVLQHFKGNIAEWDVVNECLDDDQSIIRSNPSGYTLRQTVWQRAIGDDYIDSAFVYAHRADPSVQLYLNDYDVELQGKAKAVAFYNLTMRLKNAGIPIDGVGLQCHFSIGGVDSLKLENTIQRFGKAGLKCIITELDMGISSTTEKNLQEQARQYRIITDIVLNNDNCQNMVIWGLKDNDSWRSTVNPLLYTSGLSKKTAWYAVRSALRHRAIQKEGTGISHPVVKKTSSPYVYSLQGICMGSKDNWQQLASGIYIVDGKLTQK